MKLAQKILRRKIYNNTEKPKHYVHIDKAITNQEKRQVQYNNWCKRYGVYNGSYLPLDPETLEKKGWTNITCVDDPTGKHFSYERKSSGQTVRHDIESDFQYSHYHWINPNAKMDQKNNKYIDRYGIPCIGVGKAHHLASLDKDYIKKRKIKKNDN